MNDLEKLGLTQIIKSNCNKDNVLIYNNNKPIQSFKDLSIELGISDRVWRRYKKYIDDNVILLKEINKIYLNPKYNNNYTKDVFDLFEEDIKQSLTYLEYLKIKSKWYDVNHQISISSFKCMESNISGLYRLYNEGQKEQFTIFLNQ